jgi:hypothetical protein
LFSLQTTQFSAVQQYSAKTLADLRALLPSSLSNPLFANLSLLNRRGIRLGQSGPALALSDNAWAEVASSLIAGRIHLMADYSRIVHGGLRKAEFL